MSHLTLKSQNSICHIIIPCVGIIWAYEQYGAGVGFEGGGITSIFERKFSNHNSKVKTVIEIDSYAYAVWTMAVWASRLLLQRHQQTLELLQKNYRIYRVSNFFKKMPLKYISLIQIILKLKLKKIASDSGFYLVNFRIRLHKNLSSDSGLFHFIQQISLQISITPPLVFGRSI